MRLRHGPVLALAVLGASALAATTGPGAPAPAPPQLVAASTTPAAAADPHDRPTVKGLPTLEGAYRFVSHPDLLNQDVGDVTTSRFWRRGMPLGTNASYERSLDVVLDDLVDQDPAALLVAGDFVEGAWGQDVDRAGVFGPTRTDAQRRTAVREAASVYFRDWAARLRERELPVYPALGDHEIGDNPWAPVGDPAQDPWLRFKGDHVALWKQLAVRWTYRDVADHPGSGSTDLREVGAVSHPARGQARSTAYATRLSEDLLLASVDVFRPVPGGGVQVRLDEDQEAWLAGVLRRARKQHVPWVVVQGHVPVMGPVRARFSSRLGYDGDGLLDLMRHYDVDVYLCGEVHDHTVTKRAGLVQVAHGGLFYRGEASFVVGQATTDRLLLETRAFDGHPVWGHGQLWSTEGGDGPRKVVYEHPSRVVGAYALRRDPARPGRANRVDVARGISAVPYRP